MGFFSYIMEPTPFPSSVPEAFCLPSSEENHFETRIIQLVYSIDCPTKNKTKLYNQAYAIRIFIPWL